MNHASECKFYSVNPEIDLKKVGMKIAISIRGIQGGIACVCKTW